ncbi:MAG: hypothetical protein ACI4VQ_00905 [Clostridia bacterium]
MAIVEKFYNNDRARDIRELLTNNFTNVARYIPNNFLILSTIERQNLSEDYKTHFKLVFDKEMERVYRWSEIKRNWEQYLIYAWDEYARTEANENSDKAFTEVELGVNLSGQKDPYSITFYSREYTDMKNVFHDKQAKDSIYLTALNVKFNDTYSVQTIIQKLLDDFSSLNNFVGNRDDILQNADLTQKTVCGAIKEINNKTIDNKVRLDDIESGATKVPEAIHAEHADLADVATLAKDSEKLGGQLPSYYAKKSELDNTKNLLDNTITRVTKNESDIAALQNKTDATNTHLQEVDDREKQHYQELQVTQKQVDSNSVRIGELDDSLEQFKTQMGWAVLLV